MVARWLGFVGVLGVLFATTRPALAAEPASPAVTLQPKEKEQEGQHHFALGAQVGFYNPNGLALRGGFRPISLEAAAGWVPSLLSYGGDSNPKLKLIAPFELTPQLLLGDIKFDNQIHGAFRLGYRYNLALGHGFTFGGQLSRRWGHLQLEGLWGISVFPKGSEKLREDNVVPENPRFNFPPSVTWGLTVGLMYYP